MKDLITHLQFEDRNTGQKTGETLRITGVNLNLDSVEAHYRKRGAGALKTFSEFTRRWENPECQELIEPRASITFVPTEKLLGKTPERMLSELKKDFSGSISDSPMTALLTWTLGKPIERHITGLCSDRNPLIGLLTDVAASLLLNEMHQHLRKLVTEEAYSHFDLFPMAEHYPGIGSRESSLIPLLFELSGADKTLDIGLNDHMMITPKKSQCSILLLGEKSRARELVDTPCIPCQGRKCLYYQLGGCHIPEGRSAS